MKFRKCGSLRGELTIPGDKSISHRSVMFGSLAKGTTEIYDFLQGADCLSTISCFRSMGIEIENKGNCVLVHGNGLHGLKNRILFWTAATAEQPPGSFPGFCLLRIFLLP